MKKIFSFSMSTLSVSLINLLSLLVFTRIFPPEDYGKANLLISYAVVISTFMTLSVDQVVIHYFYSAKLKNIFENFSKYFLIIFTVLVMVTSILYLFKLASAIDILLIILYSMALMVNKIYNSIFRMENDPKKYFYQTTFSKIIELVLILSIFSIRGSSYIHLLYPFIISIFLVSSFQFKSIFNILNKVNQNSEYEYLSIKQQLYFSIPIFLSIIVTTVTQNIDKFIVTNYVDNQELGIYYISFKLVGILTIIYTIVSIVWVPKAIKMSNSNDEKFIFFMESSIKFFQIICLLIFLGYVVFGKYLTTILGYQYQESLYLMDILIIIPFMMILSEVYSTLITVKRKTRYHLKIAIIILLSNIVFSIILASLYGVYGASFSLFITYILLYVSRFLYFKLSLFKSYDVKNEIPTIVLCSLLILNILTHQTIFISIIIIILVVILIYLNAKKLNKFIQLIQK